MTHRTDMNRRYEVLRLIRDGIQATGAPPEPADIAAALGCGVQNVYLHIKRLIHEGLAEKPGIHLSTVRPTAAGWAWKSDMPQSAPKQSRRRVTNQPRWFGESKSPLTEAQRIDAICRRAE